MALFSPGLEEFTIWRRAINLRTHWDKPCTDALTKILLIIIILSNIVFGAVKKYTSLNLFKQSVNATEC